MIEHYASGFVCAGGGGVEIQFDARGAGRVNAECDLLCGRIELRPEVQAVDIAEGGDAAQGNPDQSGQEIWTKAHVAIVRPDAPAFLGARSCRMAFVNHNYSSWDAVPLETMSDVISRRVFSGEKAMVAQVYLKKDAVVPLHSHESEQITYIMEGALKFELEGREVVVRKGELLLIPSNVPHRAVALEDTLDLEYSSPIRRTWLEKDDSYLRRGERDNAVGFGLWPGVVHTVIWA